MACWICKKNEGRKEEEVITDYHGDNPHLLVYHIECLKKIDFRPRGHEVYPEHG